MISGQDPAGGSVDILIVEDSATQAMKLRHILERQRHRVSIACNGEEALAALQNALPSMVISDINMPRMDGYQLCEKIKDDPRTRNLPVILLTGLSDPQDILKGLECGADNFIVKPYDEEFLLSRIHYVLANQELRKQSRGTPGTEIFFAGRTYRLKPERVHSLDLLLSTYETAVHKNLELTKAKDRLESQACDLREKNAQMAADLEMARELQASFLPQIYPAFPRGAVPAESALRFCHRYSTTTELGGDSFDVFPISDSEAGVFICDVMGHGVRAALVTAIVRGLKEELSHAAAEPGEFLTQMNVALCGILKQALTPLFVTAFYAVIDVRRGTIRHANAGHPHPFHIRRAERRVERLDPADGAFTGALGVFEKAGFRTAENQIAAGDLIMLFTDGVYEVESEANVFYDQERLASAVANRIDRQAGELFDEILAEIREFSARKEFQDDVCLLGVEVAKSAKRENDG